MSAAAAGGAPPVLVAAGLGRAFFGNVVLRDVSIACVPGTIHALLGENGAGKSTLINLLSGALTPDSGTITVAGQSYRRLDPGLAQRLGIAVVHQELSLAPHLSVAENIALGAYPRRLGLVDYGRLHGEVRALFAELELDIDPAAQAGALPLGTQQLVEIAKALYRRPRVLILDEPTSSLTAVEVARLQRVMRRLQAQGIALLFISHRLDEVLALCDHVTVLKDGQVTASRSLQGVTPDMMVRLMVGRDAGALFPDWQAAALDKVALQVEGLATSRLRGIDLTLRRGEILGLGGLLGQGQEDLLLALGGAMPRRAGRIRLGGAAVPLTHVAEANRRGVAYVPADRKREGLHLLQSLHFNLVLPTVRRLAGGPVRAPAREAASVAALLTQFAVRGGGPHDRAVRLSGGNQQKVAIARWMPLSPSVLLLNDPTRGVDVETKREVYRLLRRLAAQGTATILLSSDTPELVQLCDRVMVIADGRVRRVLDRRELSEAAIVAAAMQADNANTGAHT